VMPPGHRTFSAARVVASPLWMTTATGKTSTTRLTMIRSSRAQTEAGARELICGPERSPCTRAVSVCAVGARSAVAK
jgi:hypothetical protein